MTERLKLFILRSVLQHNNVRKNLCDTWSNYEVNILGMESDNKTAEHRWVYWLCGQLDWLRSQLLRTPRVEHRAWRHY